MRTQHDDWPAWTMGRSSRWPRVANARKASATAVECATTSWSSRRAATPARTTRRPSSTGRSTVTARPHSVSCLTLLLILAASPVLAGSGQHDVPATAALSVERASVDRWVRNERGLDVPQPTVVPVVPPLRPRPSVGLPANPPRVVTDAGLRLPTSPRSVTGTASWCAPTPRYCHGWQPPALVAAVGSFRYGDARYRVLVIGDRGQVTVTVVSYGVLPKGRIIDLSTAAFEAACGPLSRGVCSVTVEGLR